MNQLDQYHTGESGTVFDGHVDQITLGWDVETCRDVNAALRLLLNQSLTSTHMILDPRVAKRLEEATADLDYRCALAASRNRRPANEVR